MLQINVKTPEGLKTFETDDIPLGALEDIMDLEGKTEKEAFAKIISIIMRMFPEMTKDDAKCIGINQAKKLLNEDVKQITNPVQEAVKN